MIQVYNDAFVPSFEVGKHPEAMGQPARECWKEVWGLVGDQIEGAFDGTPTWNADTLIPIYRNGRMEEVYWTYGYSPAYDEKGVIGGVLVVCTETTSGVLANRRLELSAQIAKRVSSSDTVTDVVSKAFDCCKEVTLDIPFAAALTADGAELVSGYGLDQGGLATLRETIAGNAVGPGEIQLARPIPIVDWPEPATSAFVLPYLDGSIAFGLSPRLPFNEPYRRFLVQLVESLRGASQRIEAVARQLRVERERRDLLLQAPVAAALVVGPDLVFELANRRYVEMVGREVEGKRFVDAFPEIEGAPILEIVTRAYRDGAPYRADEMRVELDRDGSGRLQDAFFTFNLEPIRGSDGQVEGLMVIAVEITELVSSRRALESALADRAALVERLEAASRAKDEFLAMLGHEMRNPLSPIVTALEIIKLRDDSAFEREREIIERQTHHLVRLVDDLLDVARIVGGKIELRKRSCDLGTVISRAVELSEDVIAERCHELSVTIPEPIAWWGDPDRMAQVLSNLLINAARYTEPNGKIDLSAEKAGETITIRVTDNGQGLEPEMLDRVFEMFVQGTQDMDRNKGGLGLGLTLTKTLVELHGGTVVARSNGLGQGSTFEVQLPADVQPSPADHPTPVAAAPGRRILVVDDNVDAAEMLAALLETAGHTVKVCHDGAVALQVCRQFRPEIALLDIGLPVMDGYELARRLSEEDAAANCRLVALTGYGQSGDRDRSEAAGFSAHLVKPVDLKTLLEALVQVTQD